MTTISVLGCGWLGFPLAKKLLASGYEINGATTSLEKLDLLQKTNINPFLIHVFEDKIEGDFAKFIAKSTILIINIPPKLRGGSTESYFKKIALLVPYIEQSTVEKVVFVSSTSVYNETELYNNPITENTTTIPETESGKQLLECENILMQNINFKTTVLRFGGLVGDDRNPIFMLSGKQNIINPDAPVNLIHLEDCIGIIKTIIESDKWNEIYNAVAPFDKTRKQYYEQKAISFGLVPPHFDENKTNLGKKINSQKLILDFDYKFKFIEKL